MEKKKLPTYYKYCVVPMCNNTTARTPEKLFFAVPAKENLRKKWCRLMRRGNFESNKSARYCCEDHFDLKEDLANYWQYKLMNAAPKLKPEIVPHKFECQEGVKLKSQVPERRAAAKRKILNILNDSEASFSIPCTSTSQMEHNILGPSTLQTKLNAPGRSASQIEVIEETPVQLVLSNNKAVQVSFRPKKRSKGVNVNL